MLTIFDFDVRGYALPAAAPGGHAPEKTLERLGRFARFAERYFGLDGIGAVERFSAMHGPGALQALARLGHEGGPSGARGARSAAPLDSPRKALQGLAPADEALLTLPGGGARVLAGGEVRSVEGVRLVAFGAPRALIAYAGAFPSSLFSGFQPRLGDALRTAARLDLLVLARQDGSAAFERRVVAGLHGVLSGPDDLVPRALARALGWPLAGGSGARARGQLGARRTALALDDLSFRGIRDAFLEGAVTVLGPRGPVEQAFVRGAATFHEILENVRDLAGLN
jgi:hypothetical protein